MNWRRTIAAGVIGIACATGTQVSGAAADSQVLTISPNRTHLVTVEKGKPKTVRTQASYYEIVVGDPDIANVQPLTNRSFYVLGVAAGTTGIALFDDNKQLIGSIDVEVSVDTTRLKTAIRENVPDAAIDVKTTNGQIVLSGSAPDQVSADRAKEIAGKFAESEEDVINSVSITSSQQVQLKVRFVEVNRSAGQELGVDVNRLSYNFGSGSVGYNRPDYFDQTSGFLGNVVSGGWNIDVALQAMEERGVARSLAEPNLVARSGESASFLAGGEFPIAVTDNDGSVTVQYKKFGVGLEFTPVVLKDGLISLEIEPEVSSIDQSYSFQYPVLSVRRAKTSVDLRSGQSFMLAGLYQAGSDTNGTNLPGARKVPVLGALFSSKKFQRRETDLVVIVTPNLVRPIEPGAPVATPLSSSRPATETESVLLQVDEVKTSAAGPKRTTGHTLSLEIDG